MSHISRVRTQMVEKEYLLKALADLGYSYEEGNFHISRGRSEQTNVEIRVRIPLSYDVGFKKTGEHYEIIADWWGVRSSDKKKMTSVLLQRYAYHATLAKLTDQGFELVNEETSEKGEIRLVLRRTA
jgi:hypothetical protein